MIPYEWSDLGIYLLTHKYLADIPFHSGHGLGNSQGDHSVALKWRQTGRPVTFRVQLSLCKRTFECWVALFPFVSGFGIYFYWPPFRDGRPQIRVSWLSQVLRGVKQQKGKTSQRQQAAAAAHATMTTTKDDDESRTETATATTNDNNDDHVDANTQRISEEQTANEKKELHIVANTMNQLEQ